MITLQDSWDFYIEVKTNKGLKESTLSTYSMDDCTKLAETDLKSKDGVFPVFEAFTNNKTGFLCNNIFI